MMLGSNLVETWKRFSGTFQKPDLYTPESAYLIVRVVFFYIRYFVSSLWVEIVAIY